MQINEKILNIRQDKESREIFINENTEFICRCASKVSKKYVDKNDEIFSEALIAFNDAIDTHNVSKGNFYAFAKTVISNRVIDWYRKQNKYNNVVSIDSFKNNKDGTEVTMDIEDKNSEINDAKIEIYSLKKELEKFDISFFDLPKSSPKSKKTRKICMEIVEYIVEREELVDNVYNKKCLPVKQIIEELKVNKKIPERYRKYIIAGILITNGRYEIVLEYFNPKSRRCE